MVNIRYILNFSRAVREYFHGDEYKICSEYFHVLASHQQTVKCDVCEVGFGLMGIFLSTSFKLKFNGSVVGSYFTSLLAIHLPAGLTAKNNAIRVWASMELLLDAEFGL